MDAGIMCNTSIWVKSQELAKFHLAFEEQMLWKVAAVRIVTCTNIQPWIQSSA